MDNENEKDLSRAKLLRQQMSESTFKEAMRSNQPAIPNDEVFKELLRRLEIAERK